MKTMLLLLLLIMTGLTIAAQNEKCLAVANVIVDHTKGKIERQAIDYNNIYNIKAGFPSSLDLEMLKSICDTAAKGLKYSYNWRLNYDKNFEKEYIIGGKKLLITIYFNDKFLFFEFPNE